MEVERRERSMREESAGGMVDPLPGALRRRMSSTARHLITSTTTWMDTLWDPKVHLLRAPVSYPDWSHMVRETSWYALGLLTRGAPGDLERALQALETVLDHQFDRSGAVHHGTWRHYPDEPEPGPTAEEWCDYDPNWREFIGCALLLILHEFEPSLPASAIDRIDRALALAAEGALIRAVAPSYTNIALMGAYLFDAAGHRQTNHQLRTAGERLARQVHDLWVRTSTFPEFNAPTYYGVDLFALALWRACAPSQALRRLGVQMEQQLWHQIADRYHPDLRTIVGPYDRTYGMDMRRYPALTGLWIALVTGSERAPLPPAGPCAGPQAHDWCFAPCFALLGAMPPVGAVARLNALTGPHHVTTVIEEAPRRTATSWLGPRHMIGAQDAGGTKSRAGEQYCPVTVHWAAPGTGDDVYWLRAAAGTAVDADVDTSGVLRLAPLHADGERTSLTFEAYTPHAEQLTPDHWQLPGMTVRLSAEQHLRVTSTDSGGRLRITVSPATADTSSPLYLILRFAPHD
ncbi:hypothetical protein NGB36_18040 [Streptomyces sp. RB6PN25]|uniref:Uncharacterized protein n=1 Tax=Streptomyces humicola TaxID=2953240 RepID=A0ABT1PXQ2_9ACTN|nr:hypothetical protein [Streptomyces humicola]MCQ4082451.1 hypothetical protein [Streptomyces humicola]